MTTDQELKKLLEKKAVQQLADYKVLACRYYRAVRTGYHNPEKVAERFDRIVKRYGIEVAEKMLTNKIFTFGMLRGHLYAKDGWTSGAFERRQAALEARSELIELYTSLKAQSKELRATLDALEDMEMHHVHQNWWKDVRAEAEAENPVAQRPDQTDRERLADTHQGQMALEDRSVDSRDRLDEIEHVEEHVRDEMERR